MFSFGQLARKNGRILIQPKDSYFFIGQVRHWITIYEPATIAFTGYGNGVYAPGVKEPGTAPYIVGHNLLKAHVKVYQMYQNEFKARQHGKDLPNFFGYQSFFSS